MDNLLLVEVGESPEHLDAQPDDLVGGEASGGELGQVLLEVAVARGVGVHHHGGGAVPRAPHRGQDVLARRVLAPAVAQRRLPVPQQLDALLPKKKGHNDYSSIRINNSTALRRIRKDFYFCV